jgi:hypothetical protein
MVLATLDAAAQQAAGFEHFDVLGNGGRRHRESLGQFPDRSFASSQTLDDAPSRRIGQRRKNVVQVAIVNHLVNYIRTFARRQWVVAVLTALVEDGVQVTPRLVIGQPPLVTGPGRVGVGKQSDRR